MAVRRRGFKKYTFTHPYLSGLSQEPLFSILTLVLALPPFHRSHFSIQLLAISDRLGEFAQPDLYIGKICNSIANPARKAAILQICLKSKKLLCVKLYKFLAS